MTPYKGLDVSYWQGDIDFHSLIRDGYKWIIIRDGYGTTTDKKFLDYVKGAKAAGLPILGVYHFCYALTAADAIAEAKACIKNLEAAGLPKNIMVSYDFEYDTVDSAKKKGVTLGKAQYLAFTDAFHNYMRSQGYTNLAVYFNYDYYTRYCTEEFLSKYIRWLAWYNTSSSQTTPRNPIVPCDIQQWSESGDYDEDWLYNLDLYDKCTAGTVEKKEPTTPDVVLDDGELTVDEAIEAVIRMAKSQIGYLEKASDRNLDSFTDNAGSGNYTKYWRDIRSWSGDNYQAQPWCAGFVTWVLTECFGIDSTYKLLKHYPFVYCPTLGALFNASKTPKVGSIVLFYKNGVYGHTGIVVKVTSTTFTTIEGNTSGASGIIANGGGVCQKTYNTSEYVAAGTRFVMPDYSIVSHDLMQSAPAGNASNAAVTAPSSWKGTGTAHCTGDSVNVRKTPGGDIIGVLGKGNQFEIDGNVSGNWTHVYAKGIGTGYVYSQYVSIDNKIEASTEYVPKISTAGQNIPANINTAKSLFTGEVTASSLYVRSGIGTSYAPIKSHPLLQKGTKVDIYDIITGTDGYDWYYIRIKSGSRYVFGFSRGDYIKKL